MKNIKNVFCLKLLPGFIVMWLQLRASLLNRWWCQANIGRYVRTTSRMWDLHWSPVLGQYWAHYWANIWYYLKPTCGASVLTNPSILTLRRSPWFVFPRIARQGNNAAKPSVSLGHSLYREGVARRAKGNLSWPNNKFITPANIITAIFWGELKQSEWKEFEVVTGENVFEHRSAVPNKECMTVVILFG